MQREDTLLYSRIDYDDIVYILHFTKTTTGHGITCMHFCKYFWTREYNELEQTTLKLIVTYNSGKHITFLF